MTEGHGVLASGMFTHLHPEKITPVGQGRRLFPGDVFAQETAGERKGSLFLRELRGLLFKHVFG